MARTADILSWCWGFEIMMFPLVWELSVEVQSNLLHQWLHQSAKRNWCTIYTRYSTKLDSFIKGQFAI